MTDVHYWFASQTLYVWNTWFSISEAGSSMNGNAIGTESMAGVTEPPYQQELSL